MLVEVSAIVTFTVIFSNEFRNAAVPEEFEDRFKFGEFARTFRAGFAEWLTANTIVCVAEFFICEFACELTKRIRMNSKPMEEFFFMTSNQFVSVSVIVLDCDGISSTSAFAAKV